MNFHKVTAQLVSAIWFTLLLANAAMASELEILISNVHKGNGDIYVQVCNEQEFNKQFKCSYKTMASGKKTEAYFKFWNIPNGRWGVMAFQDSNGNGKMDKNFMGIPTEGYGMSNNPRLHRAPVFDDLKIDLTPQSEVVKFKLNY